jgi:L-fuculokinase
MIIEAEKIQPGADGVTVLPSFVAGTGPTRKYRVRGTILGLTLNTDRRHLCRAAFEGLSFQLRHALDILSKATEFHVEGIRVVGGGAKNDLWNQIRADVTGLAVRTIEQKEATSIGAALFAFLGAGVFKSLEEAQTNFAKKETVFKPTIRRTAYDDLFKKYIQLPPALKGFYTSACSE